MVTAVTSFADKLECEEGETAGTDRGIWLLRSLIPVTPAKTTKTVQNFVGIFPW